MQGALSSSRLLIKLTPSQAIETILEKYTEIFVEDDDGSATPAAS